MTLFALLFYANYNICLHFFYPLLWLDPNPNLFSDSDSDPSKSFGFFRIRNTGSVPDKHIILLRVRNTGWDTWYSFLDDKTRTVLVNKISLDQPQYISLTSGIFLSFSSSSRNPFRIPFFTPAMSSSCESVCSCCSEHVKSSFVLTQILIRQ
jgi:hypothetical protein